MKPDTSYPYIAPATVPSTCHCTEHFPLYLNLNLKKNVDSVVNKVRVDMCHSNFNRRERERERAFIMYG